MFASSIGGSDGSSLQTPIKNERIADFKPLLDTGLAKQSRHAQTLKIRKDKKQQTLKKKRGIEDSEKDDDWTQQDDESLIYFFLNAEEDDDRWSSLKFLRCIVTACDDDSTITTAVEGGVLPRLLEYLGPNMPPEFVFESLWSLANIAATNHSADVVHCGAVDKIFYHLKNSNSNQEIKQTCILALTNILSDGGDVRQMVLTGGLVDLLLQNLQDTDNISESLMFQIVSSFDVICREPLGDGLAVQITTSLMALLSSFAQIQNRHLAAPMNDILWSFSYLSKFHPSVKDFTVQSGVVPYLVSLLNDNPMDLHVLPVLRTLGNLAAGAEAQTQSVLDGGILAVLQPFLDIEQDPWEHRKEAAWIASNICAGNKHQVQLFFETGMMKELVLIALNDRWAVRNEATWALANFCAGEGFDHIQSVIDIGAIAPLVAVLEMMNPDEALICEVLDALYKILEVGGIESRRIIEECDDGHDWLNKLTMDSGSAAVTQKATKILMNFFEDDGGDENKNTAPAVTNDNTYKFGVDAVATSETLFGFGDNSNLKN